jgi:hypothetical protein
LKINAYRIFVSVRSAGYWVGDVILRAFDRAVKPDPDIVPDSELQNFKPRASAAYDSLIGLLGTASPTMLIDCADATPLPIAMTSDTSNNIVRQNILNLPLICGTESDLTL